MSSRKERQQQISRRSFFLIFCKLILWSILGLNFFRIQILSGAKYKILSDRNRFRMNILQAPRGLITDRNGEVLVCNAFTYNLSADLEKDLPTIIKEVESICNVKQCLPNIEKQYKSQSPIVLCTNLSWDQIAKIESNIKINEQIKINQSYKRVYLYDKLTGYITGYTGLPSKSELENKEKKFLVGKNGLEMSFDDHLQGKHGAQKVEVDAFNKTIREVSSHQSIQGKVLRASIDIRLQKQLFEVNEDRKGIYIAMDVCSGEVIGMYSTPGYDPNSFTDGIRSKDWNEIMMNKDKPMINRAICSLYPPGSTFKMITLLAILNAGISPSATVYCSGEHRIGTRILHCWKKHGHGYINAYNALANSCNIYFAVQGINCGIEAIAQTAREFGLGKRTGIELPFEADGLMPNKEWKLQQRKKSWTVGDTVNASIGQGYILATPIQLLVMTARLASGKCINPTLVASNKSFETINGVKHLDIIREAMYNAMHNHHWEKLNIAGKTGTAQVISKRDAKGKFGDHAMFVGFAPYASPRYAVMSIVENAGWGSETALPITKKIFRSIFELLD